MPGTAGTTSVRVARVFPRALISGLCLPRRWDPPPAGPLRHAHGQGEGTRSREGPGATEIPADERLRGYKARGLGHPQKSSRRNPPGKGWEGRGQRGWIREERGLRSKDGTRREELREWGLDTEAGPDGEEFEMGGA